MPVDLPARPNAHSLGAAIHGLRHKWGWIVAFGVFLDIAGMIALGSVVFATLVSVFIVGIMMIFAGFAELGIGLRSRDWGHFLLWMLGGLLYIVAGSFALMNPLLASLVLTLFLGAGLIAAGLLRLFLAFQLPAGNARWLVLATGLITALFGLVIVMHWPTDSLLVLGLLLGIDLMFHGIGWIFFGFWLRNVHRAMP
jgi:uncharacterized membrane protein HdeD (DUF308 family)